MKTKCVFRSVIATALCMALIVTAAVIGINLHIQNRTASRILPANSAAALHDIDCILVLGCFVHENGTLSHMLEDRIKAGIQLYQSGASSKLLMSGDHGQADYNEVAAMKDYAVRQGIPSYDIFMDHAGFSTYESLYRAKEIFAADKILIVTQEYHLPRALYIAEKLGIEAYGVSCDTRDYAGQFTRDVREILARVKDFVVCCFKPKPTFLGDTVPVSGNGDVTNDDTFIR